MSPRSNRVEKVGTAQATDARPCWVQWADIDADLSITEWAVWIALRMFADEGGTAWPTRQTIARRCRGSLATVKRALRKLEKCGLILSRTRGQRSTTYALATDLTARPKGVTLTRSEGSHRPVQKGHSDPQKSTEKSTEKIRTARLLRERDHESESPPLFSKGDPTGGG